MKSEKNYKNIIFGLSNFKPYQEMQEIELAPITLIYGQNSGGKTSLLESLLCTCQSLDENEIEKGYFNLSGSYINSGTYTSVKNKYSKSDYIYFKHQPKLMKPLFPIEKRKYLDSMEAILTPEIILHLKNQNKNKTSTKLFIEKIELIYRDYFKGLNLVFESKGNEEYIFSSSGNKFNNDPTPYPYKINPISKYELSEDSIKNFKKISNIGVEQIALQLKEFLRDIDPKEYISLIVPNIENQNGPTRFFPRENLFRTNGLIKIAALHAGAWLAENRKGPFYKLRSLSFKEENELLNNTLLNKFIDHQKGISDNYFDLILNQNIIISLFIESSEDRTGRRKSERVYLNYVFEKKNINYPIIKSRYEIYKKFSNDIELYFPKKNSKNIIINELEYQLKLRHEDSIHYSNVLQLLFEDLITTTKKDNEKYRIENQEKLLIAISESLEELKLKLDELKHIYDRFYPVIEEYNSELTFKNLDTEKFYKEIPILVPRFEAEIIKEYSKIKKQKSKTSKLFADNIKNLKSQACELIYDLDKIFYNLSFDINTAKIHYSIQENRIQLLKEKSNFEEMYNCVSWLQNDMSSGNQFEWKKELIIPSSIKDKNYDFIKKESFAIPLIQINLFPLQLSSKIIHLGPARSGGKRYYDFEAINKVTNSDVGYLFKIKNFEQIKEQISLQLQESKIANGVDINSLDDKNHDVKELIIYPFDDKNKNKKIKVNIVDTGYGISQILPIIINSLIIDSQTILVQQPETHLHPRLQAEVGSIIAKSISSKNKKLNRRFLRLGVNFEKKWIIETHSETLLFRLLKEIRKGNIEKDDLNVLYIDHDKNKGSRIKKMLISEKGELISQWPNGFFSTDINEIFD